MRLWRSSGRLRSSSKLIWRGRPRRRRAVPLPETEERTKRFLHHAMPREGVGQRMLWILIFASGILVIAMLVYTVFFSGYFSVRNSIILNNSEFPTITEERLKSFLVDVEEKNLFTVDLGDLAQSILEKSARIRSIQVERILPDTIRLTLDEYPVIAHCWQGRTNTNALVNEPGFIVALIPNPEDFGQYPTIKLFDDRVWKEDMRVLPHADLEALLRADTLFENQFGVQVVRTDYYEPNHEAHLVTNKGWEVQISLDRSVQETLADLILAFEEATIADGGFSVVDLRIPGRIFVCRTDGQCMRKTRPQP